ncbi:MAG: type II and III secretion system protein family protein [Alphaproteobacteria bacterium]
MSRISSSPLRTLCAAACAAFSLALSFSPAARAVERVVSNTTSVAVEISKGELYKLDSPAATVFIADPNIADVQVMSATLIYIYGITPGDTNLYAVGANDQIIANMQIHVVPNITRLDQAIDQVAPDSTVQVSAVQDSLVITGAVNSAVEAADLQVLANQFVGEGGQVINRARVDGPNQVNLRVRFVEARREDIRQLGINWETLLNPRGIVFGLLNGADFISDNAQTGVRTITQTGTGGFNVLAGLNRGSQDINVLIDALDGEGLVSILAEPNLTAVSGETASFLAGGEFPIPVSQDNDIAIEYQKFGVSLEFTATILGDNRISMRVRPEVSEISNEGGIEINGFDVPVLITRRAETTVEMGSGQTFAIAGLFQSRTSNSVNVLPIMGDLPIIGALFRSEDYQRNESELVILLTPYLVEPPVNRPLSTPIDPYAGVADMGQPMASGPALAPAAGPSNAGASVGGFILQ